MQGMDEDGQVSDARVTARTSLVDPTDGSSGSSVHPLDQAAWSALTGPHAVFAVGADRARRYPADVSPFAAVASLDDLDAWSDLRALYAMDEVTGLAIPAGQR